MSNGRQTVPVAVIGIGAVMPEANDRDAFWKNILDGRYSIREVPPERWRVEDHYDPDPAAPDKTYCKIGAFVSGFEFNPIKYRIPPRVAASMDEVQKWAVEASRQALEHAGYVDRDFDRNACAVVIGNALAGELQFITNLRVYFPRYARALSTTEVFRALSAEQQKKLLEQFHDELVSGIPPITEDSMPGELSNVIAGRVANVFGLRGPNYTADAACASSLAALESALTGLSEHRYDMVLTGGVDSSMAPHSFVKFSKIGALSADGSYPFDRRASGFVMGEGCAIFLLKRLEDAERDGDRILAVIRGIGSSSDGRGKGITAPNPEGQRLAIERAYKFAGVSPADVTMIEAHGTSTVTGDRVEGNVVSEFFSKAGARPHSIAMGSIKSQIGHLKSAAGAAALFKAIMSISEGVIPASINFEQPNPEIPFDRAPVFVPTEPVEWKTNGKPRVAGVSSFGFGGTNFHAVLSEYRPSGDRPKVFFDTTGTSGETTGGRHILAIGAKSTTELKQKLARCLEGERAGEEGLRVDREVLSAPERLVIEYGDEAERSKRIERALAALDSDQPARWKALANQGIFRGRGRRAKLAFLFPGQGSQYIGMLAELRRTEPVVAETFAQADAIMEPILGRPLTSYLDAEDTPENREALRDTNVCQPAMLAADISLLRLFEKYGIRPDVVAGHSMGEYAALVAAGMLDFENAMRAVSSRAREMSSVRVDDPGKMAAVLAPRKDIEELIAGIEGVVPANLNSYRQTVIAGATAPMNEALERIKAAGLRAVELQVSHAFHSYIVAPACEPLRRLLGKLDFHPPRIPLIANVDAKPYEFEPEAMDRNLDRLAQQIASPVRWIETIESMYDMGVRLFVEVGAKRVLANLTQDIVDAADYHSVASNNPKLGDWPSFAQALAACAAYGHPGEEQAAADTLQAGASHAIETGTGRKEPAAVRESGAGQAERKEIVISGAGLGLPGGGKEVFAEDNVERLLDGQVLIDPVPDGLRQRLAGQRIVRLVKDAPGGPVFEVIDQPDRVSRLLGQKGRFDLAGEFGIDPKLVESYDVTTRLAIAAGLLALRDAGIPLVMKNKTTTTGGKLPLGYRLPEQMRDDTGIIFASAFPGYEQFAREMERRHEDELLRVQIEQLERIVEEVGPIHAVTRRLEQLRKMRREPFGLDRKFIFRALSFGHAQLAELIGARGPNVQVNAACSSTTLAVAMASDWIRLGRCRRVLVVGADDVTNPTLAPWLVGGLLATGAVTSEAELEKAALPFDRRRNGMIPGMGAVGLVVEEAESCSERGMVGIARILGTVLANSAFHGSRLEPDHIAEVMDRLMAQVEREHGIDRRDIAPHTVFVSHETYTPARGGSAAAEVRALRRTFGELADKVVVANTKGYTGHPMAVGIEDAAAAKMLEHQTVPPIPNYKEPDPDLGGINLSKGGRYDVKYALRLAAGFGSQVTMTLMEKVSNGRRVVDEARYNDWLKTISGRDDPRLEVVHKTLRIYDEAAEKLEAARNGASTAAASAKPPQEEKALPVTSAVEQTRPTGAAPEEAGAAGRGAESKQPAADTASAAEAAPERPEPSTTEPQVAETTPALDEKQITERILAIVSEKTGYPVEMLELDLDLEADLGIDTVKQAETFAEVRKAFGIPKQDDLKLSDYPTLGHIIRFAMEKIRQAGAGTQAAETRQEAAATATATPEATVTTETAATETTTTGQAAEEPAEAVASAAAVEALDERQVTERILAIVSEKTGYPVEMLE
ncbi:MAG: acyltransferase domain-containing protein, partial [Deltaproteobacteria bacterium]